MRQLVDDNASLEISISVRVRGVPQIHPAAPVLAIGRRHEVSVVESAAVLRVSNDGVVLSATTAEVVLLEITRHFVEAVTRRRISYRECEGEQTTYR